MKIINCHLPKTATITTQKMFGKECIIYGSNTLNGEIPKGSDIISFTIVRDPLERFCSAIKMFVKNPKCKLSQSEMINIALDNEYSDTELYHGRALLRLPYSLALHTLPMFHSHLNVFNQDKTPKADNLIDFNNFIIELENLTNRKFEQIPHENKGADIDVELTEGQQRQFNDKYRDDILFYRKFLEQRNLVSSF
jgi:disulfide oxidoreductase YuzD